VHQRKTRKDAGQKRKHGVAERVGSGGDVNSSTSESDSDSDDNGAGMLKKHHCPLKSAPIVNTSDDE
jgi:hypothetical protein